MNSLTKNITGFFILFVFALLFAHSELGPAKAKSLENHIQHDYCHLMDHTVPSSTIIVPQALATDSAAVPSVVNRPNPAGQFSVGTISLFRHKKLLIHNSALCLFRTFLI